MFELLDKSFLLGSSHRFRKCRFHLFSFNHNLVSKGMGRKGKLAREEKQGLGRKRVLFAPVCSVSVLQLRV